VKNEDGDDSKSSKLNGKKNSKTPKKDDLDA
jgi:hypothetical protein